MSKEQHELVDDAYKNYQTEWMKENPPFAGPYTYPCLTQDEFIDKCKTASEFSETWGLKIEERELSLEERKKLYEGEFTPGIEVTNDHWLNSKLITRNIPTKLITITYNNETVEIYE